MWFSACRSAIRGLVAFGTALALWLLGALSAAAAEPPKIQFNRDIRSILSQNCFACHGPDDDAREADLRLDIKAGLFGPVSDGVAVVPGKAQASVLLQRIKSSDPDQRMPPADSGKKLTAEQIQTLERWVASGADWQGHWAYIPPTRADVLAVDALPSGSTRNDIDRFVQTKLREQGLQPSAEADRVTLIRRLSFDLTGLPPKPEDVEAFVNDQGPDAYERLVDRLLASPHYGERMAIYWLDLVRFADTIGYHSDNPRNITPYRDYVIAAFNSNKPFDQFTIEQLAGDLIPEATTEQKVASGYNRLLMTTEEGGAQPKEYSAKYMADRVRNLSAVWMGSTMGCCECHDHKFDPFSTEDFYSLAAFFADVQETPVGKREPGMLLASDEQAAELKRLDDQVAALRQKLNADTPELAAAQAEWERAVRELASESGPEKGSERRDAARRGRNRAAVQSADRYQPPKEILDIVLLDADKRSEEQGKKLAAHYRTVALLFDPLREQLAATEKQRNDLFARIPKTLITVAQSPRELRILPRGNWLDDSGEAVAPAVPHFLRQLDVSDRRANRMDLAQWLTARDNPLVARVFVNRLWMLFFGQGISKSMEDFGAQGEWPTNPELLDWLAVEFIDSGWDVKRLARLMVASHTYRQTSAPTAEQKARDPLNRYFARQSRFRLEAEIVRDNALAVSGLLVLKIGGESAQPYQPAGYWDFLNFPKRTWQHDNGENQYRRGLYTHWQRTFLHPSLLAFDAPTREECASERVRSNVPQQALVLLNDSTYVEAARVLAERVLKQSSASTEERLNWLYRSVLSRLPKEQEQKVLIELLEKHRGQYQANRVAAEQLIAAGLAPVAKDLDAAELAAWASVTRAVLNLHETITRN
ncbi:MAG: PSD1 and planctomycete cytochrome C domain-containing protein [Pirellulales bacterium]